MNKKKYFVLTTILFFSLLPKTYASCNQEEIDEFKKIEDDYKITYEFNKDTKDYTITLHQNDSEKYLYVFDEKINTNGTIGVDNNNNITISKMSPGEYVFEIVTDDNDYSCELKKIELKLLKYNIYSEDPLCNGIEEFYLCQPYYEKDIDRETFESRVNTYKKTKVEEENKNQEEEKEDKESKNKLLVYIQNNLYQVIIIAIFIILTITTIIVTIIQQRKSRRLE